MSAVEALLYPEVRSQIRDGDVLCFRGDGCLSRTIMQASKGRYSHAGLALWWGTRLMVVQAELTPGVQAVPISRAVDHYPGSVDWYALSDDHRSPETIDALVGAALAALGQGYSVSGLLRLGFHYAVGWPMGDAKVESEGASFICSELVAHCFSRAGIDLVPKEPDSATSPEDISTSRYLTLKGALRRSL